jgi:hypothetical protein
MKNRIVLILFVAMSVSLSANAAKLVIATDQINGEKASAIQRLIQTSEPFNLLSSSELTVQVKILDPKIKPIVCKPMMIKYTDKEIISLQYWSKQSGVDITEDDLKKYRNGYTIDRLVECDHAALVNVAAEFSADHMLFVRESNFEGGSGGAIPVILAGSRTGIGLHEWLHTFGLADEYAYKTEEAPFFCSGHNWVNVAIFNDAPPYSGSGDVRARHATQIPWLATISPKAFLTTGDQLGSPHFGQVGIFKSATCSKVVPVLKSWKPTGYTTVMEQVGTSYIPKPYWPAILSGLGVSQARITKLMKAANTPKWNKIQDSSPGNPPQGI